ncbi:MAG: hypothetical protein ACKVX7_19650 [Planctomycetota bacterium]
MKQSPVSCRCFAAILFFAILLGCTASRTLTRENVDELNFVHVFGAIDVQTEVVNSSLTTYGFWHTDDWEFELLTTKEWVAHQIRDGLGPIRFSDALIRREWSPWYTPTSEGFDAFALYLTSIPYVHMFVSRGESAKKHVFIRKD